MKVNRCRYAWLANLINSRVITILIQGNSLMLTPNQLIGYILVNTLKIILCLHIKSHSSFNMYKEVKLQVSSGYHNHSSYFKPKIT